MRYKYGPLICGTSWFYKSKTEKVIGGRKSSILPNWCCLLSITVLFTHPWGNHSSVFPLNGKEECYPRMLEEGKMGKLSHLWAAAPRRTGILSSEIMSSLARPSPLFRPWPRPSALARPRSPPTTSASTSSWGWNPRRPINDIPDSIMGPSCELDSWLNHCQTWLKYTLHSTQGKKAEPSPRVVLCWGWL